MSSAPFYMDTLQNHMLYITTALCFYVAPTTAPVACTSVVNIGEPNNPTVIPIAIV